jgi:membrane-associated HD superfamily phosphohydrolase
MRFPILYYSLILTVPTLAENPVSPPKGAAELRGSVREWIETMQKIQHEEDTWEKDHEVLKGYREGLEKELEDLKEQIQRAKVRKDGGDKQSLDKMSERDRFAAAQEELARQVQLLETGLSQKFPLLPETLRKMPKVAESIELVEKSLKLPADQKAVDVSKRLFSAIELLAEVEKFQQGVHVHNELRKDSQNREFKMQVVYFGLASAYAVNEDGSFAAIGRSAADGWKFTERNDLAPQIQQLVASANSEKDATFTQLPLIQP